MFTLSDPAVKAIRILTSKPGIPENSGLRISHLDSSGTLTLSISPGPTAGDEIIEADGVRVFLHSGAATMLSDRELAAEINGDDVIFLISDHPEKVS